MTKHKKVVWEVADILAGFLLTALVLSPFCVYHKVLLLPTYSLSLRRNKYKFFGRGSKTDMDFFARAK
jgi:hypothetical protein